MTTEEIPIDRVRAHWHRAASYPASKETVYSGHAEAQEFEASAGKRVLEYGCGGGSDAMSFLRRGATVVYADVTHGNVDAASRRMVEAGLAGKDASVDAAAKAIPLKLRVSAEIPYPDGTFDLVSAHGVLHHIVDPVSVLKEFHRVLKPNGLLFVMLYTEHLERRFERQIADLMLAQRIGRAEAFGWLTDEKGCPYARSYTTQQGKELLEAGGFRLLKTTDYNRADFRCFKSERVDA